VALRSFVGEMQARLALFHGPLAVRVTVAAEGEVMACDVLLDRVAAADAGDVEWEVLRASLVDRLRTIKFPAANGETAIIFGAPLTAWPSTRGR
jgi:hypothetical protein